MASISRLLALSKISVLSKVGALIARECRPAVVRGVLAAGLVLGAVWLGGSSLAIAQATDQETDGAISAVGVIDVQSVLRQSLAAQSIQEQIDARREAYQSQVTEEERALREAEQDLARKRAILSVEDYQTAVRDFQAEVADIQRKVQSRKRGLDEAFAKAMSEVRQKMVSAVAEIAEERGYDLVLFKNQIVIAAKSLDITEEVRRRLDEALPRVEVDLPPDE